MVAEPISWFLMMPGLALGAVLTPFGLGEWPLEVAGFAIDLMNRVAHVAANAPYALINVASGPTGAAGGLPGPAVALPVEGAAALAGPAPGAGGQPGAQAADPRRLGR